MSRTQTPTARRLQARRRAVELAFAAATCDLLAPAGTTSMGMYRHDELRAALEAAYDAGLESGRRHAMLSRGRTR